MFNAFKEKGIITGGFYDENRWLLFDERVTCTIDFAFNQDIYKKQFSFLGISAEDMIFHIKAYVLCIIGSYIITSIQSIIREIKYVLEDESGVYTEGDGHGQYAHMNNVCEFFSLLPYPDGIDMEQINSFQERLYEAEETIEARQEN